MASVGLGGGLGLVGYRVQWVVAVVKQPACSPLTCWVTAEAQLFN